jgi:iron complex transport system ATP-binding protein
LAIGEAPPAEILTPELLAEVFGVHASVVQDQRTGAPVCLPHTTVKQPPRPDPARAPSPARLEAALLDKES